MGKSTSMDNRNKILDLIAPAALKALAGSRSFQLGQEYFEQGAVSDLVVTASAVRAHVAGTESYRVVLREDAGELSYHCPCAHAADGNFCKHSAATAFAWLARGSRGYFGRQPAEPDMSLRVAIALWESDVETAWQYANLGVSDRALLIELAARPEGERLDDAVELNRRIVPVLLEQTSNAAYEEALGLVKKMVGALNARQRGQEMVHYLKQLRVEFKRKRNLITLLDRFVSAQGIAYASILS